MASRILDLTKAVARKLGVKLNKLNINNDHFLRKKKLIQDLGINLVLDVGGNSGQYAEGVFQSGYSGKIISFEPQAREFNLLLEKSKKNKNWEVHNLAIGEHSGQIELNVSNVSGASSILKATGFGKGLEWHGDHGETVSIERLDRIIGLASGKFKIHLKADVQGYEKKVLLGAKGIIDQIQSIELECSSVELYEGESLAIDLVSFLGNQGYNLFSIDAILVDKVSARVLQYEMIFDKR